MFGKGEILKDNMICDEGSAAKAGSLLSVPQPLMGSAHTFYQRLLTVPAVVESSPLDVLVRVAAKQSHKQQTTQEALRAQRKLKDIVANAAILEKRERVYSDFHILLSNSSSCALKKLIKHTNARDFITILRGCAPHHRYELIKQHVLTPLILYSSLTQCKLLIKAFYERSGMAIYRSGMTIPPIVEALETRLQRGRDGAYDIRRLQLALCERAHMYHAGRSRGGVTPMLHQLLESIREQHRTEQKGVVSLGLFKKAKEEAKEAVRASAQPNL